MPTHAEKRRMPYSADEMYALIADVARYPEFLPWCAAARVRRRVPLADGDGDGEVMDADLIISFKVYRERFGSRVTLRPASHQIDVEYLDGPFRHMRNHWHFRPEGPQSCEVDFFVDFEFRSAILEADRPRLSRGDAEDRARLREAGRSALWGAADRLNCEIERDLDAACTDVAAADRAKLALQ